MNYNKPEVYLEIDEECGIEVDSYNWTVIKKRVIKKEGSKNYGRTLYDQLTFHHDLTGAIESIVKNKTAEGKADTESLKAYLSWYQTTMNAITNRVLSQKKLLQEALELNGVM